MMKWEVIRGVTGKLIVDADGFNIIGDALVFYSKGMATLALAKGEWAFVRLIGGKDA